MAYVEKRYRIRNGFEFNFRILVGEDKGRIGKRPIEGRKVEIARFFFAPMVYLNDPGPGKGIRPLGRTERQPFDIEGG